MATVDTFDAVQIVDIVETPLPRRCRCRCRQHRCRRHGRAAAVATASGAACRAAPSRSASCPRAARRMLQRQVCRRLPAPPLPLPSPANGGAPGSAGMCQSTASRRPSGAAMGAAPWQRAPPKSRRACRCRHAACGSCRRVRRSVQRALWPSAPMFTVRRINSVRRVVGLGTYSTHE